jgi:cysteine desulfurase
MGGNVLPIYLDYNATTPIDPRVLEAMMPYFTSEFGNASSNHRFGQSASRAMQIARRQVAELINAKPSEIIFTGGGSEASNQAIKGTVARFDDPSHLIISSIEHPATTLPCEYLESRGHAVSRVPVDRTGRVDSDEVRRAIRPTTRLISIMHSNNEVGTIQPIREISRIAREHGVLLHTDVAQSLGKVIIDVEELGVDLMTIAGHKLYAPKGIGVLYVRRGTALHPLIHGASHERGLRAGTENIPYIAGLGRACELCQIAFPEVIEKLTRLRDRLHHGLQTELGERIVLNGHPTLRLPNTLNLGFLGEVGSELLASLPDLAASTGAACHDGKVTESPILKAMGLPTPAIHGAVRLTVGRFTTEDEIDQAIEMIARRVRERGS